MFSSKSICALLTLSLTTISSYAAEAPSSKIPDRRDFPVNSSVKPCENFYEYVCSKVNSSFKLREDRSNHDFAFSDSNERILEKKKKFFLDLSTAKPESSREESLKNFYLSCMNSKARAQEELHEQKRELSTFLKMQNREDFLAWIEASYLAPEASPLSWGSTSNFDNPLASDLYMVSSFMTLPEKSYYKNEVIMKDFRQVALSFFKLMHTKSPTVDAQNLLQFESGLAEVTPAPQEFRQIVNNRSFISRADLLNKFPSLRFAKLLNEVPEKTAIRNFIPESLTYLNNYLATASLEQLRATLLFHSLYAQIDDSNPEFFKTKFNFQKKHFGGPNQRPVRAERCTRKLSRVFAKEIDSILLPRVFPNFPKEQFISIAEKIRGSILKSLETNTWLTTEARTEAIKKMKTAKLQLVSPNNDIEWDFLPEGKYDPTKYLANEKTLSQIEQKKSLKELRELTSPDKWEMGPLTVNAYYDASYNKFVMPIGILQYPFYDPKSPIEQNLGAVGSVIGHELGHGVDDQGSRYDSEGKQRLWMTMKDLAEFSKRTELLISQFDHAKHNGKLTLGENIGDLVGLTASLEAAKESQDFKSNRQKQQDFFLSYARVWCEVARPKAIENQLKTDPHSLGTARVNEQVKHHPEFREAFLCQSGDPMVLPVDKTVHIW